MSKKTDNKNKYSKVSFCDYIDTYEKEIQSSIGFIGQKHDFFISIKAKILISLAKKYFINPKEISILDIGCGIGLIDHCLSPFFKNLYGVDIEEPIIEKARAFNPDVKYSNYNGSILPFNDNTFEMALAINVMHHVIPARWEAFTNEMFRILKPKGLAVVFEHNPLNLLTRLAVNNCEFDKDAVLLRKKKVERLFSISGFEIIDSSFILFFPFKYNLFRKIENAINWLPLGAQYYLIGKK